MLATIFLTLVDTVPKDLARYLARPEPAYSVSAQAAEGEHREFRLTSQTWQGAPWQHDLLLTRAASADTETALLIVTGDRVAADAHFASDLARRSGLTVATLFNVPNQPLWDMREDDLIAHTFAKYLETGDPEWPLLFPMTKSVIKAMDAIGSSTGGRVKRFVVTGASKRGWTTWLAGATKDPRIVGLAPVVYDNLNLRRQMPHQLASWGKYSDMIQDYTNRGLQAAMATERGQVLTDIVDPHTYLADIRQPVLIVNGSNDPYWTVDSLSVYWHALRGPKSALILPNEGHSFRDDRRAYPSTLAAFASSLAAGDGWPNVEAKWTDDVVRVTVSGVSPKAAQLWIAESPTLDFRQSTWKGASAQPDVKGFAEFKVDRKGTNLAAMVEVQFERNGAPFFLTTPVRVLKKRD